MFVWKNNSHFAVFPEFEEGKEGKRKMGEHLGCQVLVFLIEDWKLLERFSHFVGDFSYPKHTVYQC